MNIYVDIDNTVTYTHGMDYKNAVPRMERIFKINQLYKKGNTITYWTARGTKSGIDFTELTRGQLNKWGAKHHKLLMGKPAFDLFVDDKAFNSETYFTMPVIKAPCSSTFKGCSSSKSSSSEF